MSTNRPGAFSPSPEATRAAHARVRETLLRCWIRETGIAVDPRAGLLRLDLPASGLVLFVPVDYRSACGWHRFGTPMTTAGSAMDAGALATALVREISVRHGIEPAPAADGLARILDSLRRTAIHIHAREAAATTPPFLAAEQALITGHPFHPAAQSRQGACDAELRAYSPELRGSFRLHWFAAHESVLASGGTVAGGVADLLRSLASDHDLPAGYLPVPAHPWQARVVRARPDVLAMLADRQLVDLGPLGPAWYPTASLRTVWRPDTPVMLKLSLGMRITNSRRVNLRTELELATQISALLDTGMRDWLSANHPAFRLIEDPAWVGVEGPPGTELGLRTAIRLNPFGAGNQVACVAGLVADRPDMMVRTDPTSPGTCMLAEILDRIAARTGAAVDDVAADWFGRYLGVVVAPALDLYARRGVGIEAHQQNTLVTLDDQGWPVNGWYRDSQGYYVAASRADAVRRSLPGFGDSVAAVFDDALVDERVAYYLMINNVFGVTGALGASGKADERRLLAAVRTVVSRLRDDVAADGTEVPHLFSLLLDSPTLPCKANFVTCVDGRDELVGPVSAQSVYVDIANPLTTEVGA